MSGQSLQSISFEEVLEFNRLAIEATEGLYREANNNLLNPGSLHYALEEIQGLVFGQDIYPTVIEKAAILAWRIIVGHVFNDGNKRTAMLSCVTLLELNGYHLQIDFEVKDMALAIANRQIDYQGFVEWLRRKVLPLPE